MPSLADARSSELDSSDNNSDNQGGSSSNTSDDDDDEEPVPGGENVDDFNLLIKNWLVLWGFYLTTGSSSLRETQYNVIRDLLSLAFASNLLHFRMQEEDFIGIAHPVLHRGEASLPSCTSIRRYRDAYFYSRLTLPIRQVQLPSTRSPAGSFMNSMDDADIGYTRVNMVLPSSYALEDIATPSTWHAFQLADRSAVPVSQYRRRSYSPRIKFSVDRSENDMDACQFAYINDIIDIYIDDPALPTSLLGLAQPSACDNPNAHIRAQVRDIYGVQHYSRMDAGHNMTEAFSVDTEIHLQYMDYDATEVNGTGEKTLLKPGDLVAVLTLQPPPPAGANAAQLRLLLIHRFWISPDENERHVIIIDPEAEAPLQNRMTTESLNECFVSSFREPRERYSDVRETVLVEAAQFMDDEREINDFGTLDDGRQYVIYRFLIYHDGFTVYRHRAVGGGVNGIYIIPLNFHGQGRNSTNTVRVVALTATDVSPFSVITELLADIQTGITEGFQGRDADGTLRTVFLDVVGVIGDTPAINYGLDIRGHSADAYCHLCRINTKDSVPVGERSIYAHVPDHGTHSCRSRLAFRHEGVIDSGANEEECARLGIQFQADMWAHPFHRLAETLRINRPLIPHTDEGDPVIPAHLDPYHASLICPDHLITGLGKDALIYAVKVLGFDNVRRTFENRLMDMIRANINSIRAVCIRPDRGGYAIQRLWYQRETGGRFGSTLSYFPRFMHNMEDGSCG